jgi:hypothetical protein
MIRFSKGVLKSLFTTPLFFAIALFAVSGSSYGQIAKFDFAGANPLIVTTKDPNVIVSDVTLSTGTIETNIITGIYFSNEPYIEETAGWTELNQASAKNFNFTITAVPGYLINITNISFRAYATAAGPSAFGFGVGTTDIYSVNAPDSSLIIVNQAVTGQNNLTTATIKIQGWLNGSRSSTGGGVFKLDDVVITGTITPLGITSSKTGNWSDAGTWSGGIVPTSTANAIISSGTTVTMDNASYSTRNAGTTTTVNPGGTLVTNLTYTNNGSTAVNGAFQLNAGGWASGMDFTYGATGTLNFNSNGSYNVNDTDVFWPVANGPFHVNVLEGGLSLNSANRIVAGTFATAAGVSLASSTLRLNGIAQINTGGFFNTAPIYGGASTLVYNSGGTYGRGTEWSALGAGTIGVTPGYPNHVQLSDNTTFNYNNGTPLAKAMAGNLTVDAGSGFYMDYGGGASGGVLTIAGSLNNAGHLSLGYSIGDDLKIGGNFTNTGSFNGNNRAVYFGKAGIQNLSSVPTITIPYIVLTGGTTVKLTTGTNAIISAPIGGPAIQFSNSSDVLDLNGNSLTIGTSGVANTINGSGTFKGSTSSNINLRGLGSIGSVSFTGGSQNLGTLTVDRQAASIAFTLGTDLSVNTALVLINGLVDLGSSILTLEDMASTSGASPNSFVIADLSGSGGMFRKQFTTSYSSFTFPIGDSPASADGSQYSPAVISFDGATTYSTSTTPSYLSVAVHDIVHPNLVASTDYISRYWSVNRSGNFTNPNYTFAGAYSPTDGIGSTGNCVSSRWNGTNWTDGSSVSSNTVTMSGVTDLPTAATDNHFCAGFRNQEINIKGGSGAITNGSSAAWGFNNTLFAATNIGSLTTKSYEIQNLGRATLNLTGTPIVSISGANPGDFVVTVFPSLTAIVGGSSVSFSITFSPLYSGTRTAIVSIANTDTDENSYTFLVQGTGNCLAVSNALSPTSGPAGTEVTLTSTNAVTNNLTGATASFNGVAATVIPVSASQIKVLVPVGAISGNLVTTNAQGCMATNIFTMIANAGNSCQGGNFAADLFISEVTDHGTGSHSYVEIFNASGTSVNLLNYTLRIHHNGEVNATNTITLPSYSLANNSAYVLAFGSADATLNPGGITPNYTNTASGINDNDNIRLYNSSGTWIDLWGNTTDTSFTVALNDYVYRRKKTGITAPSTIWNSDDWISFSPVDYSNVGFYDFSAGTPPSVTLQPFYSPSCKATSLSVTGVEGFAGGNPLAYQWYSIAPNTATWISLSEGGIYSGVATPTLVLSNLAGLDGWQFYCQIRENGLSCYTASHPVKIMEAQTLSWNGTSWSPSLPSPSLSTIVVINGDYNTSTNGNLNACSVTVNAGKTLEITADKYVNIQNDLTVNGTLKVLDKGSLVMIDDTGIVTNNGTTAIHRFTTPFELYDYTYWSTPIVSTDIATTFARWRTDRAYEFLPANFVDANNDGFDDNGDDWSPASTMIAGKGYIIMGPTDEPTYPAVEEVVFKGKVNNGEVTIPIALTPNVATDDDFNLVGNPYPSAISADAFIRANISGSGTLNKAIEGTLYFWTHKNNIAIASLNPGPEAYNYSQDDYAMYNLSGGIGTGGSFIGGVEQSNRPLGYIASGQGFFVEADFAGSLSFNNAMRTDLPSTSNSQFYKASSSQSKDRLWLNMENSLGIFSQQLIGYFDETIAGYDQGYDGLVNEACNYISFYSLIHEEAYRIQGRGSFDKKDQVRLGYFSAVAGTFSITIDAKEGLFTNEETAVFLEDRLLQVLHELQQGPYTFSTDKGTFNDRFVLRYTNSSQESSGSLGSNNYTNEENQVFVSIKNKQVKINSVVELIDKVLVFDLSGRQIYQKTNINSKELVIGNLAASHQVLVVKTVLQNGQTVSKKIMH